MQDINEKFISLMKLLSYFGKRLMER